ncbi:MAG: hypothetical protein ACSHXZ_13295 [Gammaproteobacteria bacterium]
METSVLIAGLALVVSLLSAWISYLAYLHSVQVKVEESRLVFSRERAEFLVRIDKARNCFNRLERRFMSLLERIDGLENEARESLLLEQKQLRVDLLYIEGCLRQVSSLWDETYNICQSGLAHHKPQYLKLIEEDEQFAVESNIRCDHTDEMITSVEIGD